MKPLHEILGNQFIILVFFWFDYRALLKNSSSCCNLGTNYTISLTSLLSNALIFSCIFRAFVIFYLLWFFKAFNFNYVRNLKFESFQLLNVIFQYNLIIWRPFNSNFSPIIANPASARIFPGFSMFNILMPQDSCKNQLLWREDKRRISVILSWSVWSAFFSRFLLKMKHLH